MMSFNDGFHPLVIIEIAAPFRFDLGAIELWIGVVAFLAFHIIAGAALEVFPRGIVDQADDRIVAIMLLDGILYGSAQVRHIDSFWSTAC